MLAADGKDKKEYPRLRICLCADSLYACERFFRECKTRGWRYILRYKEGSIPVVAEEYRELRKIDKNYQEKVMESGKSWYDYAADIDYNGHKINLVEYGEEKEQIYKKGKKKGSRKEVRRKFWYITDLAVRKKNIAELVRRGRMRWKIENEGFNTQKRQGYHLEHLYSKKYQGVKNHYFLTQIGHMVSQVMEAWEWLWKRNRQSREQKHRRILESLKETPLLEYKEELERKIQIRFI